MVRKNAGARELMLVSLSLLAPAVLCAEAETTRAALEQTLESRLPGIEIEEVRPAPVAGLFEVYTATGLAYADASGDYLIAGRLMDTRTRTDLSAQQMDARNAIDFSQLPLEHAITFVKGTGARRLAVFADPDCPFCQDLEKALASIEDTTVHLFLYPIEQLHPDATDRSKAIWCSEDPARAWTEWMLEQKAPAARPCEDTPIEEIQALARTLRVNATPTLFLGSGRRIGGALSAKELEPLLAGVVSGTQQNGHTR